MKAELSKKNEYWIPKHRYYELKHFCLQYPYWQLKLSQLACMLNAHYGARPVTNAYDSTTEKCVLLRDKYKTNAELITKACKLADEELSEYIFKGVTTGYTYEQLLAYYQIPCSRSVYYQLYRKFFYILNQTRDLQPL